VTELQIFPVKSCGGVYVNSATLSERGFVGDRSYMLISPNVPKAKDAPSAPESWTNHHIGTHPRNAIITCSMDGDEVLVSSPHNEKTFRLPFVPSIPSSAKTIRVDMHKSPVDALDMGQAAEDWFSVACGIPTKLVYLPERNARKVLGNVAPSDDFGGITFACVFSGGQLHTTHMAAATALASSLARTPASTTGAPSWVAQWTCALCA
jgi:uncharacterized protein YcbX